MPETAHASVQVARSTQLCVWLAACLLLGIGLGGLDFWAPDEPRYAQVTQELLSGQHGPAGRVLLHLNGESYTQKPPLYYWLAALASWPAGGVSEWSARLPSMLAGLATLLCTLALARSLLGAYAAWWAAALLLTTWDFAHNSRRMQLDILLTLFETLALLGFWRLDRGIGSRATALLALHLGMGLAMLTKGPVGFLVPSLVIMGYLAWEKRLRTLPRFYPWWSFGLSLGPVLAWLAAATAAAPEGFFGETVGSNVLGRFFSGTSHVRPFYYYVKQFPLECLPWTFLFPVVFWAARRRVFSPGGDADTQRSWRFLLAWVGVTLVFFSISAGKRGLYLIPALPAVAMLCADSFQHLLRGRSQPPRALNIGATLLASALVAFFGYVLWHGGIGSQVVPRAFLVLAIASIVSGAAGWWFSARRGRAQTALAWGLASVFAIELAAFTVLFPSLNPQKSSRFIAEAALELLGPGEPIGLLGDRALVGGLAFYSNRRVVHMEDVTRVPEFFASGGKALVFKARKFDRVQNVAAFEVVEEFREGRRLMLLVRPPDPALWPN